MRRTGKDNESEIRELENVISGYSFGAVAPKIVAKKEPVKTGFEVYRTERVLSDDAVEVIEQLRKEQQEIDERKNVLANGLFDIPATVNCKSTVQEIKSLREKWRIVGDKIRYIERNGTLPEMQGETEKNNFVNSLPTDILALDTKIKYRKSTLSKYKKSLQTAKTEQQRMKQERNIAQAIAEIEMMTTQLNAIR